MLFSTAAALGMPVMVHTDERSGGPDARGARLLIDSVLVPGDAVELFLAHLGGSGGYPPATRAVVHRFGEAMRDLAGMRKHTLWFDVSAVGLTEGSEQTPALTPEDFADLSGDLRELGLDRVVFGTDYPVFNAPAYLSILESNLLLTEEEFRRVASNGCLFLRFGSSFET